MIILTTKHNMYFIFVLQFPLFNQLLKESNDRRLLPTITCPQTAPVLPCYNDNGRANNDHGRANNDNGRANNDHDRANNDHGYNINGHHTTPTTGSGRAFMHIYGMDEEKGDSKGLLFKEVIKKFILNVCVAGHLLTCSRQRLSAVQNESRAELYYVYYIQSSHRPDRDQPTCTNNTYMYNISNNNIHDNYTYKNIQYKYM